jgi:branched-chain amino acid transport system substrate-binding protein
MMLRKFGAAAGVLALTLVGGCATQGTGASNDKSISVGVSAPMTGQFAEDGAFMKQGIDLAVKEINAGGGIHGKLIKVYYEDDQGPNPTAASNAVTKLITQDQVIATIGPHFTPAMLPAEAVFKKYKVPALTGASGTPITAQGNEWIHRIRLNDQTGAKILVDYVIDTLGWKKIGLDYVNSAFGQAGIKSVKAELKVKGVTPVAEQSHADDTKDFTSQVVAFKDAQVDGVIAWTDDQPSGLLAKTMATQGATFGLAGSTAFSQPAFLRLAGANANGVYAISDFTAANPDPKVAAWKKKFSAAYGSTPELYATAYYDATNVLADALRRAKTMDGAGVQAALMSEANVAGVITTYSQTKNGDMVSAGLITKVVKGEVTVVKKVSIK